MSPGTVCPCVPPCAPVCPPVRRGDSLHPLVTLPAATTWLNTELRPGPSKQRTTETVSENDFVSRVSYRAAEAADPRQSKDVYRSIEKRMVVSWPRL